MGLWPLTLIPPLSGEPGRRVAGSLETIFQVVAVGVHVPDLATRPRLLAVQVDAQPWVAREGVRVPVVEAASGVGGAAEDVDHHRPWRPGDRGAERQVEHRPQVVLELRGDGAVLGPV